MNGITARREGIMETVTLTDKVVAVTRKAILLDQFEVKAGRGQQEWIAKSQIVECDCEIDDIEIGEEITIEIPAWLARRIGAD